MKYILLIMIWTGSDVQGSYTGPYISQISCVTEGDKLNTFLKSRLKEKDYKLLCVKKGDV
jgi:hypothetical protein